MEYLSVLAGYQPLAGHCCLIFLFIVPYIYNRRQFWTWHWQASQAHSICVYKATWLLHVQNEAWRCPAMHWLPGNRPSYASVSMVPSNADAATRHQKYWCLHLIFLKTSQHVDTRNHRTRLSSDMSLSWFWNHPEWGYLNILEIFSLI